MRTIRVKGRHLPWISSELITLFFKKGINLGLIIVPPKILVTGNLTDVWESCVKLKQGMPNPAIIKATFPIILIILNNFGNSWILFLIKNNKNTFNHVHLNNQIIPINISFPRLSINISHPSAGPNPTIYTTQLIPITQFVQLIHFPLVQSSMPYVSLNSTPVLALMV